MTADVLSLAPIAARHRPHDLLWLTEGALLDGDHPAPAWATPAWRARAPVVVRRARLLDAGSIPVGLRGLTRHERWAAVVGSRDVQRALSPEAVLQAWQQRGAPDAPERPCLQTLDLLARALHGLPLAWGVTGGVGFTLATGIDVLRDGSDLDLLVRAPSSTDAACLRDICASLHDRPARVDVQVETPAGAFALLEWQRTGGPVLLKTDCGPRLCDDPWTLEGRHAATA